MAFRQTFEAAAGAVRGAVTGAQPTTVLVHYTVPAGVLVNDITEAFTHLAAIFSLDQSVVHQLADRLFGRYEAHIVEDVIPESYV